MSEAAQLTAEQLNDKVGANSQSASESFTLKIFDLLFKIILTVTGLAIGGIIGVIIAAFTGLIDFGC